MKWIPKIVYGSGPTTLTLTIPQKLWLPRARPRGGSNVSESGVPEGFIIRRDQLCRTELRFYESEWPSIDTWIAAVQSGASFDFWFDKNDILTKYTVYLEDPKLGEGEVEPTRDSYSRVYVLPVTIRTTTGTRFDVRQT